MATHDVDSSVRRVVRQDHPLLRRMGTGMMRLVTGYLIVNLILGVVFPLLLLYPPRRGITAAQETQVIREAQANGIHLDAVTFETADHITLRGWMMRHRSW